MSHEACGSNLSHVVAFVSDRKFDRIDGLPASETRQVVVLGVILFPSSPQGLSLQTLTLLGKISIGNTKYA